MPQLGLGLGTQYPRRVLGGFSAEAQSYFTRLDAAGDTTYTAYKTPIAHYIDGLVTLGGGYWDTMATSCLFVGVGFQGCFVPLRSGMPVPTNNNFVSGDQNVLTGLVGNASTKLIKTGVIDGTDLTQNDISASIYITTQQVSGGFALGTASITGIALRPPQDAYYARGPVLGTPGGPITTGFFGAGRDSSTNTFWRRSDDDTSGTLSQASSAPAVEEISVFGNGPTAGCDARLATYHIGPAINLTTLNTLQDTLITELAAI